MGVSKAIVRGLVKKYKEHRENAFSDIVNLITKDKEIRKL